MRDPRAAWFCRSPTARQSYCHAETHRRFNYYCPRAKPFRASNRNPAINHSTINVGAIPIRKVRFAVSSPTRNEAKEILVYAQKRLGPEILRKGRQMDQQQLLETWDIHNRINLYLLDSIEAAHLKSCSASKGRSVGEQFAHLHNVRLMWLKASAPDLLKGLGKIEKEDAHEKKLLRDSLSESGAAIKTLLDKSIAAGGK